MKIAFEYLEAILEHANESIILLNMDYKVIGFNHIARQRLLINSQRELFQGADFRDFLYPGVEYVFDNLFIGAINGKLEEAEVYTRSNSGADIWIRTRLFPVYSNNGELLGIALFALNITDRKIAEIDLRESEEKFRKILEAAPTPIIILNNKLQIKLINHQTEEVFGYLPEEILDLNIDLIIPKLSDYLYSKNFINLKENLPLKITGENPFKGLIKDGNELSLEISLNTFTMKSEAFYILLIKDVTEQVRAELKILNQYHTLQKIAAQQSHEVRRPVASILGIVNILKTIENISEEDKKQLLDGLYKVTSELDEIIRRIVIYATDSSNTASDNQDLINQKETDSRINIIKKE
jgi:PAS domain S-box-containing protein